MKNELNRKSALTQTLILALSLSLSCAGQRDAALPDGEDHIYSKESFQTSGSITTGSPSNFELVPGDQLRVQTEGSLVPVVKADVPPHLKQLFQDLVIQAKPKTIYPVKITINRKFVTVYKMVKDAEELTELEKLVAQSRNEGSNQSLKVKSPLQAVELFKVPVEAYGTLVRKKNDLDEETRTLRVYDNLNFGEATHVKVKATAEQRQPVGVTPSNLEDADRIFLASKINNRESSQEELEKYGILLPKTPSNKLYTQVVGSKIAISEITTSAALIDDLERRRALECSAELKAKHGADCVTVLRFYVDFKRIVAELETTEFDGTQSANIVFRQADEDTQTGLIEIANKPIPEIIDRTRFLDPSRILVTKKLRNKEFLFRRTIEDSPNTFNFTFAGASGQLEIVKFEFRKDHVQIVNATPQLGVDGNTEVDSELMISLPTTYLLEIWTDKQGKPLPAPRYETTSHLNPEAIAYVEWSENNVQRVASPLAYYGLEQCFQSRSTEVSAVDERLDDGMFNFTLASHYSANPKVGCTGMQRADYFDSIQANYTFKERVSFKLYRDLNTAKDEEPLMDLPYDVQKKLGFGIFTYKKLKPNKFGNTGRGASEVPLPALLDFRNGKTFTYVLAGLPKNNPRLRSKVIDSTQRVINDWNAAFRKAFAGTSLERSGDYLKLTVEGAKDAGVLGDLDKNYLYYVAKKTASTVIGLGGAHSNPRSGVVEAASSFVYGDNIRSYVETLIRRERAKALYRKNTAIVPPPTPAPEPAPVPNPDTPGDGNGDQDLRVVDEGEDKDLRSALPETVNGNLRDGIAERLTRANHLAQIPALRTSGSEAQELLGQIKDYGDMIAGIEHDHDRAAHEKAIHSLKGHSSAKFFEKALASAISNQSLQDPEAMEIYVNRALIEMYDGQVPTKELDQLRFRADRLESVRTIMNNMRDSNICVYDAAASTSSGLDEAILKKIQEGKELSAEEIEDMMMAIYVATLAHEIGHNMGLRHNFIGSFDQANFKFSDKDLTKRNYSSVMDYMPDDHKTYDGLGPYDVAAIRTAYTGMLELNDAVVTQMVKKDANGSYMETPAGRLEIPAGKFLKVNDLKTLLGLEHWIDYSPNRLSKLLLKPYMYCSDEDAGTYPSCNRFDIGSTPDDIAENAINEYRELYSVRNFAEDQIRFGWWDMGTYIARLFSTMIPLRQFLEETIYQAISGAEPAVIQGHAQAAVRSMLFFHEVIRTPHAPANVKGDDRFVEVQMQDGSTVTVERKWTENLLQDEVTDRLAVRGVEFDKVVALIMLTNRRMGFPRYERKSLRISFPEFENIILRDTPDLDRPTISLLKEIIGNNVMPAAGTERGLIALRNGRFNVDLTEMIRIYGVIGSVLNLDVNGLAPADNKSTLFRVDSGFKPPVGVLVTQRPGLSNEARKGEELSFWARSSAVVSQVLVKEASDLDLVAQSKTPMEPLLNAFYKEVFKLEETPKEGEDKSDDLGPNTITSEDKANALGIPSTLRDKASPNAPCPSRCNFLGKVFKSSACKALDEIVDQCLADLKAKENKDKEDKAKESEGEADQSIQNWKADPNKTAQENLDAYMSLLPESVGPRTMAEAMSVVTQLLQAAQQISKLPPQMPEEQKAEIISNLSSQVENIFMDAPILSVIMAALPSEEMKLPILKEILPTRALEVHSNILFSDLDALNTLFYSAHDKQKGR